MFACAHGHTRVCTVVLKMCVVSSNPLLWDKSMSWCIGTREWLLSAFSVDGCYPVIMFPHGVLFLWPWSSTSPNLSAWGSTTNQLEPINIWVLHWSIVWEWEPNSLELTLYHACGFRESPDIILYYFDGYIGILLPFRGWLRFCLWFFFRPWMRQHTETLRDDIIS